jgi:hypothetical protein
MADIIQDLAEVIPPELRNRVRDELLRGWRMEETKAYAEAKQSAIF